MPKPHWLWGRLSHLWKISRWGWFVIYQLFWLGVFTNIDVLVGKYGSDQAKSIWEQWTHPHFGWKNWAIGALLILVAFLFEGSFRNHREQEEKSRSERLGLESTQAMIVRDYSHKIAGLEKELAEEKSKEKAPKLFLEYSAAVAARYGTTHSGLFLRNEGGRAFNVEFEPEIRSGKTLLMDNPVESVDAGNPYSVNLHYCTIDEKNIKHPMGGILSGRIADFFNDLLHDGEDSLGITIKYKNFEGRQFMSRSVLRVDRLKSEITSELA